MYKRLNKIEVNGLFGVIDYTLDFDDENDVSILIAPNGYGKTTTLKLLRAVFDPNFNSIHSIREVVFNFFKCTLSNNAVITLSREKQIPELAVDEKTDGNSLIYTMKANRMEKTANKLFDNNYNLLFEIQSPDGEKNTSISLIKYMVSLIDNMSVRYAADRAGSSRTP